MAGNITSEVTSMASDVQSSVEEMGSALVDIPQADMSDTVKQFGAAAEAAKKAQKAIKALADATEDLPGSFGGSKGGKSGFGKAAGGPISAFDLHMVGEQGPELFMSDRAGTIIPNHALASYGSGGGSYDVLEIRIDAERIFITGRDIAIKRGTVSAGAL
jgi:hypothetical protein